MKNKSTIVKKACFLTMLSLCSIVHIYAANYYFSTSDGDDSRSSSQAQNPATPWQSISKLNQFFSQLNPGDSILLKSGDFFYGAITVNKSGSNGAPIVFSNYNSGNKPVITSYIALSGWVNTGGNVWETTLPAAQQNVNSVLVNGIPKRVGRYPNADAANKGYLTFESTQGNNSITDLQLGSTPNWTGGEVVIRKVRWVIDRNVITQHQQNTINYISQSGYGPSGGYGYFIQNHPQTLDQAGEWYYQANSRKFGIFSPGGTPTTGSIQISTGQNLVSIISQSNISFLNLRFSGANSDAFYMDRAQGIQIKNCELLYSGHNAITAWNSNDITVENAVITATNNNACMAENCNNVIIKNSKITNTGTNAGMGDGDSGSYEGLLVSGNNQLIEGNTIDSSGYIAVTFRGENVVVKNNIISNFSFVKDDGSGIYTWNNLSNPPVYTNRVVTGNIVLNGLGAGEGTPEPNKAYANGIYMDDNAGGVEISGNTVANCANYGLYIHNAHDLNINNNTVYNNAIQLNMTHDDIAPIPIKNVALTGNTFVSKLASQSVAEFKTNGNDISSFGTFDYNYYSRPLFDNMQIGVLHKENGNYIWNTYELDAWQSIYGKDQHSKKSPFPIAAYKVNNIIGSNLYANGNFDNNINGLYSYSPANNASTSWNNSVLDGGALQVAFSSLAGNSNKATVIIGVGAISASKKYILKFSLKGTNEYKVLNAYLRQSNASYADITARNYVTITGNRTEQQMLFIPTVSESNASIGLDIPEQSTPVYIDNVQLVEVNATITNPDDSIRFVYNTEAVTKAFTLDNTYADIANNSYSSSINLAPYSSAVLLKKSTGGPSGEVVCSATGYILREQWDNIGGNDVSNIPLQTPPTSSSQLTIFESPTNIADNYGARIRGYVCPPQTGTYTFWIAADDASELWLSTDNNPANKTKIAYSLGWTYPREFNKYASQKSASIYLQAGQKYYIEALHKEGAGGDNLAVAWQLPNGTMESPIPGTRLSPFVATATPKTDQTINFAAIPAKTYGDDPFTVSATATSGLAVGFNIVSGPATISGNTVTLTASGTVVIKASQDGNNLYNAATPVTQNIVVNPAPITCSATGYILREQWDNIGGNDVSNIPLQTPPTSSSQLTIFESPTNIADNYGARIRGYVCPPQTGTYTFWIAADDASELWLSTDNNPANKTKIAYSLGWTYPREFNKYASQKSASIYLQAGQKYYIEALHKEGAGGDNLAVAWQLPNGTMESPIPGTRLSPFTVSAPTACSGTGNIIREQWNNIGGHDISSIPLQTPPASTSQLTIFESPTDVAENYGARIRGFICPPQTGNYTFWIAADDVAELWLSTSDAETGKTKIANVPSYTGVREWNKYSSQKSATIYLQAGYKYYIEALQKEGDGGDNLAVAWQLPNNAMEAPIPGMRLSPYTTNASSESYAKTSFNSIELKVQELENIARPVLKVFPNPLITTAVVEINLPENNVVKLELYDGQGRIVQQLYKGQISKGLSERVIIKSGSMADGIYVLRLATPTKTFTQKIVVRK